MFIHNSSKFKKMKPARIYFIAPLMLFFLTFTACDTNKLEALYEEKVNLEEELESCQVDLEDMEERVEELERKLSDIESLTYEVQSDYDDLESEVSDFSYKDWEYNVPDVQNATEELYYSIRELKSQF
jgi:chromosome segregation ATPase